MKHEDLKISKESVDKVFPTKYKGYAELTDVLALDAGKSLQDFIYEAYKVALHEDIRANTVMINKKIAKVNKFVSSAAGSYNEFPPLICGLEAFVTDELPDEYAFGLVEAPKTQRDRIIEQTRRDAIKEFAEDLKNYYNHLGGQTFGALVAYTIDQKVKEFLNEKEH